MKRKGVFMKVLKVCVELGLCIFLAACGGDSSSNSGTDKATSPISDIDSEEDDSAAYIPEKIIPIKNITITGFAQKGPFKIGSNIDVFELDFDGKTFSQTGKSFMGKVSNDSGFFKIANVSLKSQYALLRVTGNFISEINGESVHATLTAVTDLSKHEKVNVNILTHLEYDRVLYLLGRGMNFTSAKKRAEREVLAAFGIEGNFKEAENMNVFGKSDADAALVAISKLLLAGDKKGKNNRDEEDLNDLMAQIALSMEEDGEWDNIGGRNNTAGDYCEWDNKWNIASRANVEKCPEMDDFCMTVQKYIKHFKVSWEDVGQYCTSSIDNEIVCNLSTAYWEWSEGSSQSWSRQGNGEKLFMCYDYSRCVDGEWSESSELEAETYKWTDAKDGEIRKGKNCHIHEKYEDDHWKYFCTYLSYKYDAKTGKWQKYEAISSSSSDDNNQGESSSESETSLPSSDDNSSSSSEKTESSSSTKPKSSSSITIDSSFVVVPVDYTLGRAMNKKLGRGINLGNSWDSDGIDDNGWKNPIRDGDFALIKEAGFNSVRIPVRWQKNSDYSTHTVDPNRLNGVLEDVRLAIANDLAVVIDFHHYVELNSAGGFEGNEADYLAEREHFLGLWSQVAAALNELPDDMVVLEILNEPTIPDAERVNQLMNDAYQVIRANAPGKTIMFESYHAAKFLDITKLRLPVDGNIIYSGHYYEPYQYTHQGHLYKCRGDAAYANSAEDDFATYVDLAQRLYPDINGVDHVPLNVGEFGVSGGESPSANRYSCNRDEDLPSDAKKALWAQQTSQAAIANGMSFHYWAFGNVGGFDAYDIANETWYLGFPDALIH